MQHKVSDIVINQFTRSLKALRGLLGNAQEHATQRKFDSNLFLQTRLSPDMFPFVKQVQIACDNAKGAASRLAGKTPPAWSDDEKTIGELIARVDKTIDYLSGFTEKDFANYATQKVSFPWYPGVYLNGDDYLVSHALPNFYFHMTTAYALLRSSGVPVGKGDFMGEQNWIKN